MSRRTRRITSTIGFVSVLVAAVAVAQFGGAAAKRGKPVPPTPPPAPAPADTVAPVMKPAVVTQSGKTSLLYFRVAATDNVAVDKTEIVVRQASQLISKETKAYAATFETNLPTPLPDRGALTYDVHVTVLDAAGNRSATSLRSFTVDPVAPSSTDKVAPTLRGAALGTGSPDWMSFPIEVTGARDDVGLTRVRISYYNVKHDFPYAASTTYRVPGSVAKDAKVDLQVQVGDAAGNFSTPVPLSFTAPVGSNEQSITFAGTEGTFLGAVPMIYMQADKSVTLVPRIAAGDQFVRISSLWPATLTTRNVEYYTIPASAGMKHLYRVPDGVGTVPTPVGFEKYNGYAFSVISAPTEGRLDAFYAGGGTAAITGLVLK